MTKPVAAVRRSTPSMLDIAFAGGSTAVFLAIMANVVVAISLYLR